MLKKLPKSISPLLFLSSLIFIVFITGIVFFKFHFSFQFISEYLSNLFQSLSSESVPAEIVPSEISDLEESPFKDVASDLSMESLRGQAFSESLEVNRYFEGPRFYEEIGGVKRLMLIEGVVDSIDSGKQVVSIKHWNSEESVDVATTDADVYHLIIHNQDDSTSQTEASFSFIEVGDHVSYNVANSYSGLISPIWVIVR